MSHRCPGTSKQTRQQCGRTIRDEERVCRWHGGAAPQARRAAALRLAEATIRTSLAEQGYTLVDDPLVAFRQLVSETVAFKEFAAAHVAELGEQLTGYDKDEMEYLRAVVTLYERAMERAAKLLHDWVRLNMDERLVQVTERQADLLLQVVTGTLADLGVDAAEEETRAVLGRHLRAVA